MSKAKRIKNPTFYLKFTCPVKNLETEVVLLTFDSYPNTQGEVFLSFKCDVCDEFHEVKLDY
jgi:hypothetical protein